MGRFFKALLHAAIGGAAGAVAVQVADPTLPLTSSTVLLPAAASAATSVAALFTEKPMRKPRSMDNPLSDVLYPPR